MEVVYADEGKTILLRAYADTLIYSLENTQKLLVGIRIGGYPEVVNAICTAISGGGMLTVTTENESVVCTAEPRQYAKKLSYEGTYAIATMLWDNEMVRKKIVKKQEDSKKENKEDTAVSGEQQLYLLCPPDDRAYLYRLIDRQSIIPMLPSFQDYLIDELRRRKILTSCVVRTTGEPLDVWRLSLETDDENIGDVITDGLKSGAIAIPGATPTQRHAFQSITGVTSYLREFGSTLASRIRNQFQPLFDPATEPLSDEVMKLSHYVEQQTGYSLYGAQLAAAEALQRRLQSSKFAFLIAECGSGKSKIGSLALQAHFERKNRKNLNIVLCPSHMTEKWVRELDETIPNSFAAIVETPADFDQLYQEFDRGNRTAIAVISKESARDGYMRRPAVKWSRLKKGFICPDCSQVIQMDLLGENVKVNASPEFFRSENQKNHCCDQCGSALWTATTAEEQSEWVRIGLLGYVHRKFAYQAQEYCKTESALKQIIELVQDPGSRTFARGACRRYPLSTYIKDKYSGRIDGLIADELHQYAANSGQGDSMGELYAAAKKCIGMTATLINGYASGIFYLLYRVCAHLMQLDGQSYKNASAFSSEYGVSQVRYTAEEGSYNSNRRTVKQNRREKHLPGVSPLVYSRFLLENAVFLSLLDMGKDLPEYEEIPLPLSLPPEQADAYEKLERALQHILRNRSREMRKIAQKLLSVYLNLLMAYPDQPYGHKPVCNPLTGAELVKPIDSGKPDDCTEKDRVTLDLIKRKVEAGGRVLLYVNWVRLDTRKRLLSRLLENGIRAEIMEENVTPRKREKWVEDRVSQGVQVLITNPSLVETGLDLNHFTTLIFYDMAFKLFTFRQASRRSWRINQTAPRVEVYVLYYRNTMQERAVRLMASKLAVAGVIEGALTDEGLAAMSDCQDMTTILAKELAEGIRHERAVEEIAESFKKMAILHPEKSQICEAVKPEEPDDTATTPKIVPAPPTEQLSLWELAG